MAAPADNEFSQLSETVAQGINEIKTSVQKTLAEERKAHEELLAAKADNKAVSELEERLAKQEEAHNKAVKAYDEEIANLKLAASSSSPSDETEEIKQSFYQVLRTGNDSRLDEKAKNRLTDVLLKHYNECNSEHKTRDQIKAMLAGIDTTGGLLVVPPFIEQAILKGLEEDHAVYRMAGKTRISGPVYKRDARTTDAGASWEGETDQWKETSTPEYGQIEIAVNKVIAYPSLSLDLLDDSRINMDAEVLDFTREAFGKRISAAMIVGDGKRKPRGLLSYETELEDKVPTGGMIWGKIGFAKTGAAAGFASDKTQADCLIDLQGILKSGYHSRAAFIMNRKTATAIRKFKNTDGDYLWQPSMIAGQPPQLFGSPVYFDAHMPDVAANAFPVAFGDINAALLVVERRGMTVIRDLTTRPGYMRFLIDMRMGAGVRNFEAIKLLKVAA